MQHTKGIVVGFIGAFLSIWSIAGTTEDLVEIVPKQDITFQPLNPARGDASPRAGVLWGDIRSNVPTGAIIEFSDGFSSPPHIHNITYRGIVINGAVHNDDPGAEYFWMGPGSFWLQQAGEPHITAAAPGATARIFLEILEGPYLVQPSEDAFESQQRSLNIDSANLVWISDSDIPWVDRANSSEATNLHIAFLWGTPSNGQSNGTLVRMSRNFKGELHGSGSWLRAVVIRGLIEHRQTGSSQVTQLEAGSYFGSRGQLPQGLLCKSPTGCVIYVSTQGHYRIVPM